MSVVTVTMDIKIQKRAPVTRKIRRLLTRKKDKQAHKLYPEEYFCSYWLSHKTCNVITIIARLKGTSKKAAAEYLIEEGIKNFMRELVKKDLDALTTPEGRAAQAERTRFNLELRRICRELGWDIKKLL